MAWNIGAGLTVAGLSATYYAMARRNLQMERDSKAEDEGANRRVDVGDDAKQEKPIFPTTSSQNLLKKEFDLLNKNSGMGLGLNVIESQQQRSSSSITRMSSSSSESLPYIYPANHIVRRLEKDFSDVPLVQNPIIDDDNESNESESSDLIPPSVKPGKTHICEDPEDDESLEPGTEHNLVPSFPEEETSSSSFVPQPHIHQFEKKRSSVFYYRNPDFGSREACRNSGIICQPYRQVNFYHNISEELSRRRGIVPEENTNNVDSTRYLFPPILSDSKLSVYGGDNNEVYLEQRESLGLNHLADSETGLWTTDTDSFVNVAASDNEEDEEWEEMGPSEIDVPTWEMEAKDDTDITVGTFTTSPVGPRRRKALRVAKRSSSIPDDANGRGDQGITDSHDDDDDLNEDEDEKWMRDATTDDDDENEDNWETEVEAVITDVPKPSPSSTSLLDRVPESPTIQNYSSAMEHFVQHASASLQNVSNFRKVVLIVLSTIVLSILLSIFLKKITEGGIA